MISSDALTSICIFFDSRNNTNLELQGEKNKALKHCLEPCKRVPERNAQLTIFKKKDTQRFSGIAEVNVEFDRASQRPRREGGSVLFTLICNLATEGPTLRIDS